METTPRKTTKEKKKKAKAAAASRRPKPFAQSSASEDRAAWLARVQRKADVRYAPIAAAAAAAAAAGNRKPTNRKKGQGAAQAAAALRGSAEESGGTVGERRKEAVPPTAAQADAALASGALAAHEKPPHRSSSLPATKAPRRPTGRWACFGGGTSKKNTKTKKVRPHVTADGRVMTRAERAAAELEARRDAAARRLDDASKRRACAPLAPGPGGTLHRAAALLPRFVGRAKILRTFPSLAPLLASPYPSKIKGLAAAAIRLAELPPGALLTLKAAFDGLRTTAPPLDPTRSYARALPARGVPAAALFRLVGLPDVAFNRRLLNAGLLRRVTTVDPRPGEGTLDFPAFLVVVVVVCTSTKSDVLKRLYAMFDTDANGHVDAAEMEALWTGFRANNFVPARGTTATSRNWRPARPPRAAGSGGVGGVGGVGGGGGSSAALAAGAAGAEMPAWGNELARRGVRVLDMDTFREIHAMFPRVAYPAYQLQNVLRAKTLGYSKWSRVTHQLAVEEAKRAKLLNREPVPFADQMFEMKEWFEMRKQEKLGKKLGKRKAKKWVNVDFPRRNKNAAPILAPLKKKPERLPTSFKNAPKKEAGVEEEEEEENRHGRRGYITDRRPSDNSFTL